LEQLPYSEECGKIVFILVSDAAILARLGRYRKSSPECGLVLLTDNGRLAIEVYRCHPNALIPWPPTYTDLSSAMERCFPYWFGGICWLNLPLRRQHIRIPLYRIRYAEAEKHSCVLYCEGGTLRVSCSLSEMEKQLPSPPFLRCQKSFVVNLGAVVGASGGELTMCDGQKIAIARSRMHSVQLQHSEYKLQRYIAAPQNKGAH